MVKLGLFRKTIYVHLIGVTIFLLYSFEFSIAQEQNFRTPDELLGVIQEKGWKLGCVEVERKLQSAINSSTPRTEAWRTAIHMRAGCLSEFGRDLDAVLLIKEALRQDPNNGLFLADLGTSYLRLGRDQEAISTFEKALQFDQDPDVYAKL